MQQQIYGSLTFPKTLLCKVGAIAELDQLVEDADRVLLLVDQVLVENGTIAHLSHSSWTRLRHATVRADVPIEPTAQQIEALLETMQEQKYTAVIAIGGGSILDTAKLVAALADQSCRVYDLLAEPALLKRRSARLILVPTTAGTGSEVTPNSIVLDERIGVKVGIVNPCFVPDYVVLDAALTCSLPPALTASTGMDALSHALECYTSNKANAVSDLFALQAGTMLFRNLRRAYDCPDDLEAREQMLLAACLAGLAIAASGTTAVHALSYPLGGKYRIPHGVSNAILLPTVMRYNAPYISDRLADVARACPGIFAAPTAEAVIEKLYEYRAYLGLPTHFSAFGVSKDEIEELTKQALTVKRLLCNNRRVLLAEDIRSIYEEVI